MGFWKSCEEYHNLAAMQTTTPELQALYYEIIYNARAYFLEIVMSRSNLVAGVVN